ncbi:hypothetical protein ACTWPT_57970 [Nonomuraea sp. 3N208]|uniref:hypothetical protein n=1 Tax=Nonomuraea sp. 3N208 TaxID=3457421 RepID=UPI003FD4ACE6
MTEWWPVVTAQGNSVIQERALRENPDPIGGPPPMKAPLTQGHRDGHKHLPPAGSHRRRKPRFVDSDLREGDRRGKATMFITSVRRGLVVAVIVAAASALAGSVGHADGHPGHGNPNKPQAGTFMASN